jgi:hypothetical protein
MYLQRRRHANVAGARRRHHGRDTRSSSAQTPLAGHGEDGGRPSSIWSPGATAAGEGARRATDRFLEKRWPAQLKPSAKLLRRLEPGGF